MDGIVTSVLLACLTLLLAIRISVPQVPLSTFFITVFKNLIQNKKLILYLIIMVSYLGLNALQVTITSNSTSYQSLDYTPLVRAFYGEINLLIQNFQHDLLTYFLTYIYIFGYSVLPWSFFLIMSYKLDISNVRKLFYGITIIYLLTLPFYLFFPVKEVWAVDPRVEYLIPQVYPSYDDRFRLFSGITNCFPSFHTSLSVLLTLISWDSPYRNLRYITSTTSVLIIFSTLYLGIHWLSDIIAGILLAIVVSITMRMLSNSIKKNFPSVLSVRTNPYKPE